MRETLRRSIFGLALLTAFGAGEGCERCNPGDGPKVPFKLSPSDAGADGADGSQATLGVAASYGRDAAVPELEGAKLPWSGVRSSLAVDLDQDGDRDVLALLEDAQGGAHLVVALREGARFENPKEILLLPARAELSPCTVERAELAALSPSKALATFERACDSNKVAEPTSYVLLSLEPTPRIFDRVTQRVPAGASPTFTITVSSQDSDGDGHEDIALTLKPVGFAETDSLLQLVWFDRASGLVRDLREPENTLAAWAAAAKALAAKAPDQAAERAAMVLKTRRALCREAGAPELWFSDSPGVVCGRGKSELDALLAFTEAQARQGQVAQALDAYRELKGVAGSIDERTLQKLDAVLATLPATPGITLHRGTRVEPLQSPPVHLPAARFLSENSLLLQRREPALYDLASGQESPAHVPADALVRDPGGQLAITQIDHACTGYSLRVERAPALGEPYVRLPGAQSVPLLAESNPPDCGLKSAQRAQAGGFVVLGWAPQGAVVARGSQLRIVPLDLAGKPAGEPRELEPQTPPPAPLPSGAATPDGARYVEATPFGVLVHGVRNGEVELWRPEGYLSLGKAAREAAVSPSGRRVAVVLGDDTFYWLERAP
ncbi:MAG: hypothetical protein QM778_35995 [Myxococcales bacterium]